MLRRSCWLHYVQFQEHCGRVFLRGAILEKFELPEANVICALPHTRIPSSRLVIYQLGEGAAWVGNYLFIKSVESILWFRHCQVRLNLIAIHAPNMVVICLLSEALVDECFWMDRMLNTVSLRMNGGEGGI